MTRPQITVRTSVKGIFISQGLQTLKLTSSPRMHVVTHYKCYGSTISVYVTCLKFRNEAESEFYLCTMKDIDCNKFFPAGHMSAAVENKRPIQTCTFTAWLI